MIPNLERRWRETDSSWVREELGRYQSETPCEVCGGLRLKPEALAVKIAGKNVAEVSTLAIRPARDWFESLETSLTSKQMEIGRRILKEINDRLRFLVDVGLEYLSLSRSSGTLSGGESQRIRLASQIGSGLTGVLYVLDEPSIGLHQRDNQRLLGSLRGLRDLGNSVLVVEHDEEAILTADHVIDMGPLAGIHGGEIIAEGKAADIMAEPRSLTGQYLTGARAIPVRRRIADAVPDTKRLRVIGARGNNLKSVTSGDIPVGVFTCITTPGVLGRRQVDLHHRDPLQGRGPAAEQRLGRAGALRPHRGAGVLRQGHRHRPVAHRPHAALQPGHLHYPPFQPIRDWFAGLPEAKSRGYGPSTVLVRTSRAAAARPARATG